jgi:ubiquinone/menaquinone biosynthesis C-methylase UbiE
MGDSTFAGSIPELYDQHLVPLIFESYARETAARLAAFKPNDILEVAAGTGIVTRAMAVAMPDARIVATDLNQPMLDRAASRQRRDYRVTWQQADAQALPFEDQSFDAVVCQFGAMFFPDRRRAYGEVRRALRPQGRYIFAVWNRISENEFADVVTNALAERFPNDPPRFLARTPHGYHDPDTIRADVGAVGFTDISIDTVEERSRAATPFDVAFAYCQGTPLRGEIEARDPNGLTDATNIAAKALEKRFGTGPVDGKVSALVVTAAP